MIFNGFLFNLWFCNKVRSRLSRTLFFQIFLAAYHEATSFPFGMLFKLVLFFCSFKSVFAIVDIDCDYEIDDTVSRMNFKFRI